MKAKKPSRSSTARRKRASRTPKPPDSTKTRRRSPTAGSARGKGSSRNGSVTEGDLFHTILDNTIDLVYFKDKDSRFILINRPLAERFSLHDPAEAIGKTDFDFLSEGHSRQTLDDEQKIIRNGEPIRGIEKQILWPDGQTTWVSTIKSPIRDSKGRIIGIIGISRDITKQKYGEEERIRTAALLQANVELEKINAALQAEIGERERVEKLLEHEQDLFRAMMDNTTDRIYFKDRESRFLLINQSLASHFGIRDPMEAVGKRDFDYFSEEHARQAFEDELRLVASEKPFLRKEEKETWPDGHITWVSTTKFPMRDRNGRIIGTFGISRDITDRKSIEGTILQANEELEKANLALQTEVAERKRAEEELAHERELFRTMMDNSSDYIYFKDAEHRFLLINRALADHLNLDDTAQAVGKKESDFRSEEHARQAHDDEDHILADGQSITELEEKETGSDGHELWTLTSKFPMRNGEGRVIGTFGISRDITERKNMDLAIQLANDKLTIMVNWLEGRNREISVLNEMGSALEACRSLEEAYPVISREMGRLIPVDTGKLYLLDKPKGRMECIARWGTKPGAADSFPPEECKGLQSKQVYNTAYAVQLGVSCRHLDPAPDEESVYLCVPLLSQGEAIGLLHLRGRRKEGAEALPDLKQQLAVMAADHVALALANLTLRETLRVQSIRDALTGLFNRRYLEESLSLELKNTRSRGTTLGVIMIDVDRLKQVNDTFGHEAGDAMLQTLGHWLHANVRTGDISCRYGGDEFILILPNASLEATTQRAHQIWEGIRKLTFAHQGRSLGAMSVSVGVAAFPIHGETRDALLAAVDAALYKAKEQGKDRVVIAGE